MTRHCHKCGWEFTLPGQPGRSESCHQCSSDLKVCLNCVSYDPAYAYEMAVIIQDGLKRMYADLALENAAIKDVLNRKL